MDSYNIDDKTKILKKIKIQCNIINIKSKYLLNLIFDNLQKNKLLDVIRHNKKIKNILNIKLKDYKEYSELYSSIELEILPVKNYYGKFINITNEENEQYYYIYFNNKKKIEKNYIEEYDKVNNINIKISFEINSFEHLFEDCKCIESIHFKKFYRNNIDNMSYMFSGCSSLKEIIFSSFNTDNVIYMD